MNDLPIFKIQNVFDLFSSGGGEVVGEKRIPPQEADSEQNQRAQTGTQAVTRYA